MNKTVKKVFSYIGIAFLGFASGVGCLIGVSSCSSKQDQTQLNSKAAKKQLLTPEYQDDLYILKSDLSTTRTYTSGLNIYQELFLEDDNVQVRINLYGTFTTSNYNGTYWSLGFYLDCHKNNGNPNFTLSRIYVNNSQDSDALWYNGTYYNNNTIVIEYSRWVSTDSNVAVIDWNLFIDNFFTKFTNDNNFEFQFVNFNYNAFANDESHFYVQNKYPVTSQRLYLDSANTSDNTNDFTFNVPTFVSNNMVYDQIVARYKKELGQTFELADGSTTTFQGLANGQHSMYFYELVYKNSTNGFSNVVCSRVYGGGPQGTSSSTIVFYKEQWINENYRTLLFYEPIQSNSFTMSILTLANSGVDSGYNPNTTDVGLSNVFTLLSAAFTSWIPIMSIQIIPGITIGLLLFLPLITGIIVLIIWIVKR